MTPARTRRSCPRLESLEAREVPAAVGALDPSFGTAGRQTIAFNLGSSNSDYVNAVAVQPDGRTVLAGPVDTAGGSLDFGVARLNPDGTPDETFGPGGKRTVAFNFGGTNGDYANAVAVQADGRIVVVGDVTTAGGADFGVARLNPDGTLDGTFGSGGKRTIAFNLGGSNIDFARAVAIAPDGRIVVAGQVDRGGGDFDFGVARLNADGTPDGSFGPGGKRIVAFDLGATNFDSARAVAVRSDGRVVLAGQVDAAGNVDFGVARLNVDGTPDGSFGPGGKRTIAFNLGGGNGDVANALAVYPDGRAVVAGYVTAVGINTDFGVARLNADGTPDGTFGPGGKRTLAFDLGGMNRDLATALALRPDGRVVLAGYVDTPGGTDFGVARLNADGTPDGTFGPGGQRTVGFDLGFTNFDAAYAAAVGPAGRIVVAGQVGTAGGDSDFGVARLIGTVEKGDALIAGGTLDGTAERFAPNAAGTLVTPPAATLAPFGPATVNVRAAMADVNGDGVTDDVLVTGPGTPLRVAVISGVDNATLLVAPFDPFGGDFAGGGFVSAGDFDHDGRAEFVVSPDVSGGPRVTVFSRRPDGSTPVRANFFGIDDPDFRGGARTAVGDVDGDGTPDLLVAAGFGGGPRVAVFRGASVLSSPTRLVGDFFAFPGTDAVNLRNGAFVAAGDVTGDGFADLAFGGGPGGAPRVFLLSGALVAAGDVDGAQAAPVSNFFVGGNAADRGGVRVAVADLDGDTRAEVVAGSGEGVAAGLRAYLGKNLSGTGEPATFQDLTLFGGTVLPGGVFVG
ncbi:delta-60 repeat domain-containing protein [Urbifossiella limnaea]|uniref:FG-GAP repeat protein n=1 Tax=Urbifossiella limnaea TaxID=2528023 RepID=A0A517Y278_9BACT|nr:delta-60 repeat domain-containing protein [Urbifossiella limnaea]QDU23857.1 FG-GAP repeat protein [Urbifossiella limnaea]